MVSPGYLICRDQDCRFVEAWSTWHLPFMNLAPEQSRYRDELRRAVVGLSTNGALEAIYTSRETKWAPDLENVLFYNVGTSIFRGVAADALRLMKRSAQVPDCPMPLDFVPLHHVRYQAGSAGSWSQDAGAVVAWAKVTCSDMRQLRDLPSLWRLFKLAMIRAHEVDDLGEAPLAVRMVIAVPDSLVLNLAEVMKPLTDAFISALHSYRGGQLEAVVGRLSARLKSSPEAARKLLLEDDSALLGPRAVPHVRGDGLQWSPADYLLTKGEFVRASSGSEPINVSAQLCCSLAPDDHPRAKITPGDVGMSEGSPPERQDA